MTNTTRNRVKNGALRTAPAGRLFCAALLCAAAFPAAALDLVLPGNARETAREEASPSSHGLALSPFTDSALTLDVVEGAVSRSAWRVEVQGITTLQLLAPLRDQLVAEGFKVLFECDAAACGGFDFRYRLEVFPEPDMHVDLFDYRYLSAQRTLGEDELEFVSLLVSRSSSAGFIQITQVSPPGKQGLTTAGNGKPVTTSALATPAAGDGSIADQLEHQGHAILSDLAFETGSSSLGSGDFTALEALADFLNADPARRVALVGHTDAVGSLDKNIALSKRRAASVLERLVSAYGVARAQLEAEGMGYLAPVTSNLTPEGREKNRRVEAILLNTE